MNMTVVADVVFAVAVVALAAGTVTEFQFRIADICSAADGAAVGVGCFLGFFGCLISCGIKLDHFRAFRLHRLLFKEPAQLDPPGLGNYIQNILAEDQEIVCQGNHGEQIIGEGVQNQIHDDDGQIKQGKNPGLHGDDEEH